MLFHLLCRFSSSTYFCKTWNLLFRAALCSSSFCASWHCADVHPVLFQFQMVRCNTCPLSSRTSCRDLLNFLKMQIHSSLILWSGLMTSKMHCVFCCPWWPGCWGHINLQIFQSIMPPCVFPHWEYSPTAIKQNIIFTLGFCAYIWLNSIFAFHRSVDKYNSNTEFLTLLCVFVIFVVVVFQVFLQQGVVPPLPVSCSRVLPGEQRPPVDRDVCLLPNWLKVKNAPKHKCV